MSNRLTVQVYTKAGTLVCIQTFEDFPVHIGRAAVNDVVLPQTEIAREQFRLDLEDGDGGLVLRNLGTKNLPTHKGATFTELKLPLGEESTVELAHLRFRFIPEHSKSEETRIFNLADFPDERKVNLEALFRTFFLEQPPRVRWAMSVGFLGFLFALVLLGGGLGRSEPRSEADIMASVKSGIFEVVYPKVEDRFVTYEKALPVDKLPFKDRNDKFLSIGTAFYIGHGLFASAAHVFDADQKHPDRDYFLRNTEGQTFKISDIIGYSNHKDVLLFKTETMPSHVVALKLRTSARVGEIVYTAGNAHGEGLALRSGVLSSYTPENLDGAWKHLRYSAPASPGNSGGPLLDSRGNVVGVVVMKSQEENLNYAVPVELLETLPKDSAEFVYEGAAEIESGLRLNAERWKLTQPLPQKLGPLTEAASMALNKKYIENRKKFEETYKDKIFPNDPKLAAYLVEDVLSRKPGFMEIDKDKTEKWSISEPDGQFKNLNSRGSLWYNVEKASKYVRIESAYYFPKEETLTPYWKDSKKIFDLLLKEIEWSRTFAGERILIRSYGEAQESEKWTDSLGRPWITWIWRTQFDEMSHIVSCLPFPKAIACRWVYVPFDREYLERFYEKVDAHRRLRSYYSGNYAQWRAFLALGKDWVPEVLDQAHIAIDGDKSITFSATLGGHRFKFQHPANFDQEFSLGILWNPVHPGELETTSVGFYEKTNLGTFAHQYSMYRTPYQDGDQAYKDQWAKIEKAEAPFNGMLKTQGDVVSVSKPFAATFPQDKDAPRKSFWVANCSVSNFVSDAEKKEFFRRCDGPWSELQSRDRSVATSKKKN